MMNSKKGKSAPPKLHKFMHPRNPYRTPPIFKNLAQKYAEFREHCIYELDGKVRLNFKDPKALRALTTCLLDQDFDLQVSIPDGRLVPTLPLRFNYLLWIEDLLTLSSYQCRKKDFLVGVDIGCGSSCIYPLLAAKKYGWYMVATEADEINFDSATTNIKNNSLQDQVTVRKVVEQVIFKGILDDEKISSDVNVFKQRNCNTDSQQSDGEKADDSVIDRKMKDTNYIFDFTMCNPPFFGSEEETDSLSKSKRDRGEPTSVATGALQETVTEGGEVAFITQMIDESVLQKNRVRVFTTMIGSKAHVKQVKDKLKTVNPLHTAFVEFCQGRTMRWGIAWTFDPNLHLENVMSKKQMVDAKPLVLMLPRSLMTVYTVSAAWTMINKWLHQLKINVQVFKKTKYFIGSNIKAYKPTWLHQRRKKRERQRKEGNLDKNNEKPVDTLEDNEKPADTLEDNEKPADTLEDIAVTKQVEASGKRAAMEDKDEMCQETNPEGRVKRQKTEDSDYNINKLDNSDTQQMEWEDNVKLSPEKLKEMGVLEELDTELPKSLEKEDAIPIDDVKAAQGSSQQEGTGGLECILKAKLQIKQVGGLISLEALYLRGSLGKDGLNQLLQYMRNQLTNPHT